MSYSVLLLIHLLAVITWVGGMAFAHFCLRPALSVLAPPQRPQLMQAVLARFMAVLAVAAPLAVLSGLGLMGMAVRAGATVPWGWHAMAAIGLLMLAIFVAVRLGPYRLLARAVAAENPGGAASAMARVRQGVALNLALGLVTVAVAVLGR